jgi:molybdopterin-guanine dinucleotide biosynthesis protein A
MIGVVLCGGQSTRMGADKGLLKSEIGTWAQIGVDKLKTLGIAVKISVNTNQSSDYINLFATNDLIPDNESLKVKGPICGVLSAHLQYPSEDILVLACDMLLMETEILKRLNGQYQTHPKSAAIDFTLDGEPEPLCGIYTAKGLTRIYHSHKTNQLTKHSMKYVLECILTSFIHLSDDKKKYFTNFNTQAELNGL